jgi:hypothetical protein
MRVMEARRARDDRLMNIQSGGSGKLVTFRSIADDWIKERCAGKVSESVAYYTKLRLSYVPDLLDRPVSVITRPEVVAALRAVSADRSAETARRTAMVVKMVFDYAVDIGEVQEPHCAQNLARALPSYEPENLYQSTTLTK